MTADHRRHVGFEIGSVFPADSPVARFITRVCVVTNDIMLTQENTGIEYDRPGGHREGVPLFYLYAASSYFREAAKNLAADLEIPDVAAFVAGLDTEATLQLQRLRASFTPWKGSFVESRLKPIRDQVFHYPGDGDVKEGLSRAAAIRSGIDLGRGTYVETRYDFADQVITSLVAEYLGKDHAEMQATLKRLAALMMDYVHFTHSAVTHYLRQVPEVSFTIRETP